MQSEHGQPPDWYEQWERRSRRHMIQSWAAAFVALVCLIGTLMFN